MPTAAQGRLAANPAWVARALMRRHTGYVERLAAGILDLARPYLLNRADDRLRHRHIIEFFRHLVAFDVGPSKEFERFGGSDGVLWLLGDQNEGRSRHRPGRRAGLVGQDHAV